MHDERLEVVFFGTAGKAPDAAWVGGKAAALIELTSAGLPVPPGFVLTTDFFRPWSVRLRSTQEWAAFVAAVRAYADDEALAERTARLREVGASLPFTDAQRRRLSAALEDLPAAPAGSLPDVELFAVRSSALREDLAGASFAGIYDSVLAVPQDEIADALRTVFTSGLDFRAVSYMRERGFDPTETEIAVVVQRLVDSTSAGVAFSLNPQTNDYDEVVIQANRGLGETVVSGSVTPDQIVVDKTGGQVLDVRVGAKETARWARPRSALAAGQNGDSEALPEGASGDLRRVLSDEQAVEVARLAERAESVVGVPADIEWAFDTENRLHLLQARPVTTYFPLPEELRTAPGGPRRLYADSTLLEEGLQQPLSVLGARWMADAIVEMARQVTGMRISTREPHGLMLTVGGRWYVNLSNLLWLGTQRLARSVEALDVHAARVLRNIDAKRYRRAGTRPPVARIARLVAGTLIHSAGPAGRTPAALVAPGRARRRYRRAVDEHDRRLAAATGTARSLPELGDQTLKPAVHLLVREGLPLTSAAEIAAALIRWLYRRAPHRQVETALRSMPDNVTIAMGLALYRLARSLETAAGRHIYDDLADAARRITERDLPEAFLREWDAFMADYGFRGPTELDLAAPRYADSPEPVLEQMRQYALLGESTQESPQEAYERRRRERLDAWQALLDATRNPLKKRLLKRLYRVAETFGGYREMHKYHLVRAGYRVRRRALEIGHELAEAGRLDSPEQVFDLTYDDLRAATVDPQADLRSRASRNTAYRRLVERIPGMRFPVVVDSRGRIPRPARTETGPGVLSGEGVSPGTARGPAKVLRHVGEKPVLPGEILVAQAADPGWTPLFVNAAGIILETGGAFQHGALVAREYGKPCLVAVEHATRRIADGRLIEIDGTNGTATLMPTPAGADELRDDELGP